MKKQIAIVLAFGLFVWGAGAAGAQSGVHPLIGESEGTLVLAEGNTELRGLAFDDSSPAAPRLFVLDASGRVFVYRVSEAAAGSFPDLKLLATLDLPTGEDGRRPSSPRGLAYVQAGGDDLLYYLDWKGAGDRTLSELVRWRPGPGTAVRTNLALYPYRIGNRETLDVAILEGRVYVAFDASGYKTENLRALRGVIRLDPDRGRDDELVFVKHLPDSGRAPSFGLAGMAWDTGRYLWGTSDRTVITCSDEATGRGLFHFARPGANRPDDATRGLAYGRGRLWIPESAPGPDLVHGVNVTRNPDAYYEGPRILRHLIMTIQTEPEGEVASAGRVYHYYSRPYAYEQLHNQGAWPATEKVADIGGEPAAAVKAFTYDPAGDVSSRQHMRLVEYADGPAAKHASRYEIDIWTNPYRKYVYPHRVDRDAAALQGLGYLADDAELFNLTDHETYDALLARVQAHIAAKYGVPADMKNPYWAARNVLEYYMDVYYYPSRPHRVPAAVDYARGHGDANPGNMKIELSGRPYDRTQIIACSGTSVMLTGAMRYLGIPTRWLGTGTEQGPDAWDEDRNGLLGPDETATCSNGHRYTQVWLGSRYGWICFDATPIKPDQDDFDVPPPLRPQWTFMNRAAAGHLKDKRIVFNVGSALFRPLYRDFEFDERLAVDNDCGGDQRYNLQGRFDKPALWKLARHEIQVRNLCFIGDVAASGPADKTVLTWKRAGAWERDSSATVSVYLERVEAETGKILESAVLARRVLPAAETATIDLTPFHGKGLRLAVRKDGDAETGGVGAVFQRD